MSDTQKPSFTARLSAALDALEKEMVRAEELAARISGTIRPGTLDGGPDEAGLAAHAGRLERLAARFSSAHDASLAAL